MKFADLVGKTIIEIQGAVGGEQLVFVANDGKSYVMWHDQDCCEIVHIQDIVGDLEDLIGQPILVAEESTSEKHPEGYVPSEYEESFTWTFYKLATVKGWVDIRWLGESNGYYSESVSFEECAA